MGHANNVVCGALLTAQHIITWRNPIIYLSYLTLRVFIGNSEPFFIIISQCSSLVTRLLRHEFKLILCRSRQLNLFRTTINILDIKSYVTRYYHVSCVARRQHIAHREESVVKCIIISFDSTCVNFYAR